MNTAQITDSLSNLFHTEGHRIVFWHDPDQEFVDLVPELNLDGVRLIHLDQESKLELKVRLELEDQEGRYLLYSPAPEPQPDQDWLLDIRLYSRSFHADRPSMLLSELGLTHQSMREHIRERIKFFKNQDRTQRLKKLTSPDDREKNMDTKMLAVLTRADQASIFDILMKLFGEMCTEDRCDFKSPPKSWADIEKFSLAVFFWEEMTRIFGYDAQSRNLSDLLIRLLVGDMANTLRGDLPSSLQHFRLQDQQVSTNVSVFVDQWRKHLGHYKQYTQISGQVADELGLQDQLAAYDAHSLLEVMTFEAVERQIIRSLRSQIIQEEAERFDDLKSAILSRRDGHWATIHLDGYEHTSNIYATTYDGLDAVLDLLELRREYGQGLSFANADQMYQAYVRELYRFDQLYRHFHEAADIVELAGWDVLKEVHKVVESCYSNWYLDQISLCWGGFLDGESGLVADWTLRDVPKQQHFYFTQVKPLLTSSRSKVFVIISDALRYEVAEELARDINSKSRFKAKLTSQLGVLPSYTALGMAALMPRSRYGYKQDSDQILVDGKPCASLEQRQEILSQHEGIAVRAEDLLAMNKDQGRELVRPWQIIYIFHNQIDATGDSASTETKTFSAAHKTIIDLSSLVRFIVNSLNGSNVLVTADHGFLYQDTPPGALEKSQIGYKPGGVVKAKKRYILGHNLGESDNVWHGYTSITAGTQDDMEFWIPKGVNRFHFSGGAKFIHGGAMPQEVVVPVLRVKELDTKAAEKEAVRKVGVSLLGSNRKVVNTICKFEFIQTEKTSERMLPRTLVVSIRDGDTLISNEQTVTFDSDSDSMEERKRPVKLMLKKGSYDNTKEYALVLRDPETQIEYERIPVNIDLAFMDDF
jgi:uncharacterized protein (TIGR02687 family)